MVESVTTVDEGFTPRVLHGSIPKRGLATILCLVLGSSTEWSWASSSTRLFLIKEELIGIVVFSSQVFNHKILILAEDVRMPYVLQVHGGLF